ncbi:MAG: Gfo/Idh/MocA family oxidoreductase [Candidatus Hydrogenedentes bacterium]|nr:Gfo/Idh/MocA family oxidoreductase [Candidatus Hydrogenedentota bacterium]
MSKAKKIRVGFIGAGGISIGHFQRLHETKKAEVVALNEPSQKSLENLARHCPGSDKLPVFNDYKAMINDVPLDAVVVQSPHTLHYEQIDFCLSKGLHVLSEKPMTCTIKHANALIARAKQSKRILMISYQRHFDPNFRYMREQIAKGALGEVQFVQAIQSQEWLRAVKGTWRQTMALSGGGQLNDSGSHLVDIVMWVTGMKVKTVFAKIDNFGTEVDINSSLSMQFENGALGSMSVIGNAPSWYEDHSIVGSKGALYLRQGIGLIHQDAVGKPITVKLPKYTKNPDSNFIDSILGKDSPQTPPECGLRTIEVTEAAWKSAKNGKPVQVP